MYNLGVWTNFLLFSALFLTGKYVFCLSWRLGIHKSTSVDVAIQLFLTSIHPLINFHIVFTCLVLWEVWWFVLKEINAFMSLPYPGCKLPQSQEWCKSAFSSIFIFIFIYLFLQIVVWRFLHSSDGSDVLSTKQALFFIVLLQHMPRLFRMLPLSSELKRTSGVFAETAWAGAAYYLLLYMLASHVSAWLI